MKQFLKVIQKELSFGLSVPALVWQTLFLGIPFCIVVYTSLHVSSGAPWYSFTLTHFFTLFTSVHLKVLTRTIFVALFSAALCVLIAFPAAYFVALHVDEKHRNFLLFFLTLPFWTNFLIQVYSWFFLLEKHGLINMILLKLGIISEPLSLIYNMFGILVVTIYCYLPFVILPLYSIIEKIDTQLIDASMDLGASWWQTFYRIVLPLSWPGVKVGFLLVLVPVFGEFAIPAIIGGSKYMFTGSLISYYFMVVRDSSLGSAFTIMSLLFLSMIIGFIYIVPLLRSMRLDKGQS